MLLSGKVGLNIFVGDCSLYHISLVEFELQQKLSVRILRMRIIFAIINF